jgi:alkylation response protein AidB-like acyl-CoA dehydrogenase
VHCLILGPSQLGESVDFAFTEEQDELRRMVRALFADVSPEERVRSLMETETGYDPKVWKQLADLGLTGLSIPEEYGGAGMGAVEVGVVAEEAGAALLCAPFLSTVGLATPALLYSGDTAAAAEYLPRIAAGELIATIAIAEADGSPDPASGRTCAERDGDGWRLSGQKTYVLDGCAASLILVAAKTDSGLSLFAVHGDSIGLTRSRLNTLDLTRKQAQLDLDNVSARLLGTEGGAAPVLDRVLDQAMITLAAEQVGGARRALNQAVEYAKVRFQFGRAIGSFQAIKHLCADMLLEVELARSTAYYALWAAAEAADDLPAVASLAKAFCSDAYAKVTADNIQVHGGIGFTWEHPAHLYFRRARSTQQLLGSPAHHRERLIQCIGLENSSC